MEQTFLFHSSEPKAFLYFFPVFWIRFFQLLLFTVLYLFILIISLSMMFSSFCFVVCLFVCFFHSNVFSGNAFSQYFSSDQNVICADISNLDDIRNVLHFLVKHLVYWTQPKWQFEKWCFPKGLLNVHKYILCFSKGS